MTSNSLQTLWVVLTAMLARFPFPFSKMSSGHGKKCTQLLYATLCYTCKQLKQRLYTAIPVQPRKQKEFTWYLPWSKGSSTWMHFEWDIWEILLSRFCAHCYFKICQHNFAQVFQEKKKSSCRLLMKQSKEFHLLTCQVMFSGFCWNKSFLLYFLTICNIIFGQGTRYDLPIDKQTSTTCITKILN